MCWNREYNVWRYGLIEADHYRPIKEQNFKQPLLTIPRAVSKTEIKMGMFDYLIINTDKLPVTDEEKKLIGKNPNWQTKDFDCDLTEIYITDEGDLKINRWNYEEVPKEERPHPDGEGLRGLMGSVRRANERLETIEHHGYVNFYSNIGDDWYEFFAKFTDGKLVYIEGGKEAK